MTLAEISNGVIVGENDGLMRGIIRSILVHTGQQVFPAADGMEAVLLARQFQARLVMLDINMPRLNGLLACVAIRALPGYAKVPIVMLTGYDDERMRKAAARVGANDFVTKPFRPDRLLQVLAIHLDMPRKASAAGTQFRSEGPVKEWEIHRDPVAVCGDSVELTSGRQMLHVWRSVDGKS